MVAIGADAPEFTLPGTDGTDGGHDRYRLSDQRGRPMVLVFYPGDATPVCTRQLNHYTEQFAAFDAVGATMWAISPQDLESHDRFAAQEGGFAFPLLADVDKSVGRAYGILGPLGFYRRSVFVLDPAGVVAYSHRAVGGLGFRPASEIAGVVERLQPR